MSERFDIVVDIGADAVFVFELTDDSGITPLNTTGYKARMQVRPRVCSDELIDELTTENSRMEFTGIGKLKVWMSSKATTEYDFKKAVYDIEIISPEGMVTRIVEGLVIARKGVTR